MSTRPTLTNNIDANVDTINTNANNDDYINTICKAWNNTKENSHFHFCKN